MEILVGFLVGSVGFGFAYYGKKTAKICIFDIGCHNDTISLFCSKCRSIVIDRGYSCCGHFLFQGCIIKIYGICAFLQIKQRELIIKVPNYMGKQENKEYHLIKVHYNGKIRYALYPIVNYFIWHTIP